MAGFGTPSISVKEQFWLEAKPDVALIKLYVLGEGMLLVDAVENVRKKVAEISETVKSGHPQVERIDTFDIHLGDKEERLRGESALSPPADCAKHSYRARHSDHGEPAGPRRSPPDHGRRNQTRRLAQCSTPPFHISQQQSG